MQTKIKPPFYPLKNDEWLSVAKKLTHSELLVLYHLRTLEPFGDRMTESSTKDVAEATGISQRSVQRALIKLAELELIDLQIQKFAFKLRSQAVSTDEPTPTNETLGDRDDAIKATGMTQSRQRCRQKDKAVANSSALSDSPAETCTPRDFSPSKTNKTNQTLSEATRERNLILFKSLSEEVQKEIKRYGYAIAIPKLPVKPTLSDAWIIRHCEELFNQMMVDVEFQKSNQGKSSANSPAVEKVKHSPSASILGQCKCQRCRPAEIEEEIW